MKAATALDWLLAAVCVFCFLAACALLSPPDPEHEIPTAESVTALGKEARSDPFFGHPFAELCARAGEGKEICR